MAVEDVIKLVKKVATEVIPDSITFTDVKVEASNVVLYTPNLEIFSDNNDLIRKLAQNVRKRIVIKADSSVRKPILSAKQKLKEILPEEAGIVEIKFDEINGDVILEATNPGRAIGKHGVVLNQIRREVGWNPVVIRSSPMESRTLKDIRNYMLEEKIAEGRKKFLTRVGKKVFRDTIPGEQHVRVTALGGYREVGRSCHLLMTKDSKVLVDCGFNPGNEKEPSPFLSAPEVTPLEGIDG